MKKHNNAVKTHKMNIKKLIKKSLTFPTIVLVLFFIAVTLKITGTSTCMYLQYFYGQSAKDPNLIFGKPAPIRSDEWLVATPLTISQSVNHYGVVNNFFDTGKNTSLIADIPYKSWSIIFKPHLIGFLILPLGNAFAFKWWFMLIVLLISVYYLVLYLMPDRKLIASLLSIIFSLNPFIWWWYQSGTITPLASGILIILLSMSILDKKFIYNASPTIGKLLSYIILSYLLVVFALSLYPPFQIPVAIVIIFFILGYIWQNHKPQTWRELSNTILPFIVSASLALITIGVFIYSNIDTIRTISSTVYPGNRVVKTGGFDFSRLLTTYLQAQLQRGSRSINYAENPSEMSSFIVNAVLILPLTISVLVLDYKSKRRLDKILFMLTLCGLLFSAILYIPGLEIFSKITFMYTVPHNRVVIGVGLLGFITLTYIIKLLQKYYNTSYKHYTHALTIVATISYIVTLLAGFVVAHAYPKFISNPILIATLCSWLWAGILLTLKKKTIHIGLSLLAILSLISIVRINPIYRGMGQDTLNKLTSAVKRNSNTEDIWGVANAIYIENVPQVGGRKAITGTMLYPDVVRSTNLFGKQNSYIFNRYAHVYLSTTQKEDLKLVQGDVYSISLDECSDIVVGVITRVITPTPINLECYKELDRVSYPNATFYIYGRTRP